MTIIKEHHIRVARDFKKWLEAHPDALHSEIYEEFNRLADKHFREKVNEINKMKKRIISRT